MRGQKRASLTARADLSSSRAMFVRAGKSERERDREREERDSRPLLQATDTCTFNLLLSPYITYIFIILYFKFRVYVYACLFYF